MGESTSTDKAAADAVADRRALGAQLAASRRAAGLTLEQTAARLTEAGTRVGRAAVNAWETGRNVPDSLALRRLAAVYGTTADALLRPAITQQAA